MAKVKVLLLTSSEIESMLAALSEVKKTRRLNMAIGKLIASRTKRKVTPYKERKTDWVANKANETD